MALNSVGLGDKWLNYTFEFHITRISLLEIRGQNTPDSRKKGEVGRVFYADPGLLKTSKAA